eukprot:CAMPEP_0113903532 /NCGR_PEP_ID=MMETSP0780_2-20120614/22606_1 /TAXON_ID=652834 /ORGANISM="Palpitomonas bilix" /LENGTH=306 /DNA_ID=CAMNT_0000896755 /DNA_START=176 /DNA_END=1093 /DNA_ORIENTATION=- /assembly_acc=CAM_ASM_000599
MEEVRRQSHSTTSSAADGKNRKRESIPDIAELASRSRSLQLDAVGVDGFVSSLLSAAASHAVSVYSSDEMAKQLSALVTRTALLLGGYIYRRTTPGTDLFGLLLKDRGGVDPPSRRRFFVYYLLVAVLPFLSFLVRYLAVRRKWFDQVTLLDDDSPSDYDRWKNEQDSNKMRKNAKKAWWWVKERERKGGRKVWKAFDIAEKVEVVLSTLNFLLFLKEGRYPTLSHRIAGVRLLPSQLRPRFVNFEYLTYSIALSLSQDLAERILPFVWMGTREVGRIGRDVERRVDELYQIEVEREERREERREE